MDYMKLDDCCDKITDYVASGSFASIKNNVLISKEENYAIMVKTADFSNGFTKDLTYTDKHGYDFLNNSNLFGGELILSNIGSIGKVFIVPNLNRPMTLASNSIMVKPNDKYRNKYLYYFFLSSYGQNALKKISSGTSMQKFNKTGLKTVLVQNRNINEQDTIIITLDKLNEAINIQKEQLKSLDELVKSRFIEMFGEVRENAKYSSTKLKNICQTLSGGTPTTKHPEYYQGNIPWITTVQLGENYISGKNPKAFISEEAVKNSATHIIPADNILFGTRVGVGKCSINTDPMCTNQDINAIMNIDKTAWNLLFIKSVLDQYQDYFDSIKKGATIKGITINDLVNIDIPLVPKNIQNTFAEFVKQVDKSKFIVQKQIEDLQELLDSKMDEYFG